MNRGKAEGVRRLVVLPEKKNPELPAGRDSPGCPGAAEPVGLGFAAVPAACAENLGGAMQVFEQQTPPCTMALPLAGRRPGDGSQTEQGRFRRAAGGKGKKGALYGHRHHRAPSRCRRPPSDPLGCFFPVCHRFIIHLNEGLIEGCVNYGEIIFQ